MVYYMLYAYSISRMKQENNGMLLREVEYG